MFVSELMTKDLATVAQDASISKAFQIIYESTHAQIPVISGTKLVGMITEKLLAEVSPSKATSLSVYEMNYLLSKTKVNDVMIKDVFTAKPDFLVEEAANVMYSKKIGFLPVVTDDNTLIGIITRGDIFKAFIEIMGVNDEGSRISIDVADDIGVIAKISQVLKDAHANIRHISNFKKDDRVEIVVRVDTVEVAPIVDALEQSGYKITSVIKN